MKDTNVLSTKEYLKWNWDLIFSLLQHPSIRNYQLMEDAVFTRCVTKCGRAMAVHSQSLPPLPPFLTSLPPSLLNLPSSLPFSLPFSFPSSFLSPPTRFIKRLCNFYKPSNHLYSVIQYTEVNSRRYTPVAQQLIRYLCRMEEVMIY